ncbi:MAG: AAA family ATPase [Chloroflexota bacterium]|nr:AAA family ATPase [Chloroflexota bacterium]
MEGPFVGRRAELEGLAALSRHARRGRAAAALVSGPPGSGKSRLLAEFLTRSHGVAQLRLAGFEPMQAVPLAAAADLLRELGKAPRHGPELRALAFGEDTRSRDPLPIFEGAYRALASAGPLLLVMDDLQWVDDMSLALVHYLLRAAGRGGVPFVVVAAARPSPAAASFREGVASALGPSQRLLIELGPLPLEDGMLLVGQLDPTISPADAAAMWRHAHGSPFWLQSLARQFGGEAIIDQRLQMLSGDAGALLAALAVASRPFRVTELAELLAWSVDRLVPAARELVARGLAVETSGMLHTAHDLLREAALRTIPSGTRQHLHSALAELLEGRAGSDLQLLREALEHRQAAGLPSERLALRLVSSPQRRLLGRTELKLLAEISDALPAGRDEQLELDERLGELALLHGEARLSVERWRRVSSSSADAATRQRAELAAARAAHALGYIDEVRGHLAAARAAAPPPAAMAIELDALEALTELWLEHRTAAGGAIADRALDAARRLEEKSGGLSALPRPARRAYLAALRAASDAALQQDRHTDLLELTRQIVTVGSSIGEDDEHVAAMTEVGRYSLWSGRIRDAEHWFRQAWEAARRLVLPAPMAQSGRWLARSLHMLGRLAEARRILLETIELERRAGAQATSWGYAAQVLHALELSLGDPRAALRALEEDARNESDPHYRMGIHQSIAEWLARFEGRASAARVESSLAAAWADLAAVNCPRCGSELTIVSAELLARLGHAEQAASHFSGWESAAVRQADPIQALWRTRAQASLAAARGDQRSAIDQLEALIDHADSIGRIDHVLWARLDLGEVLAELDRRRAIEELQKAAALAEQIGAASQHRLATRRLRRLGVRTWRREAAPGSTSSAAAGLARLSRREAEIARLAAHGASNRQIADSLLISPKTVERHVSNALAKLGVANRTALAGVVASSRLVRDIPDDGGTPLS